MIRWQRFRISDVQCGGEYLLTAKSLHERIGIYDLAASYVHEDGRFLHLVESAVVEEASGLVVQRGRDYEEVALL